jgi:hypothetical protein
MRNGFWGRHTTFTSEDVHSTLGLVKVNADFSCDYFAGWVVAPTGEDTARVRLFSYVEGDRATHAEARLRECMAGEAAGRYSTSGIAHQPQDMLLQSERFGSFDRMATLGHNITCGHEPST